MKPPLQRTIYGRTPYLFHWEGQTVALGQASFLEVINQRLRAAGYPTRPTYWDQAYPIGRAAVPPDDLTLPLGQADQLNSVGVDCGPETFWEAMYAPGFEQASWPSQEDTLYMPQLEPWLREARAWEYDPLAYTDEPGVMGGWLRVRAQPVGGQPVGLFQLTDAQHFQVFGSETDLLALAHRCRELAAQEPGLGQMQVFRGPDLTPSSLSLPLTCRQVLEEELFLSGVDAETLFWDPPQVS